MSSTRQGWPFVLPALLLLSAVAVYPVLGTFWLSLHRSLLVFHESHFIGLSNYAFLLRDPRFWGALGRTLYFTGVAVSVELVLGLGFALLLHASFRGRGWMRTAILVPWAIPTVVSAKMWAWIWGSGVAGHDVNWLGSPGYAMHAAILVDVWKTTPFVTLILLAGLQAMPQEVLRAAQVDGASAVRIFWSITLPLLRPTIAVAVVFRTLDAMRVFDAVYVLTGGGPANTTETLSIYAYKTLMRAGDFGYGSTVAVATFLSIALLASAYLRGKGR